MAMKPEDILRAIAAARGDAICVPTMTTSPAWRTLAPDDLSIGCVGFMGHNPETNVVNRWGFSHEAPNLGVLGASVMGTSGARNPTLTVQALAWRTAEHLSKNWKAIAFL